jgi:hypothetical protein
MTNYLKDRLKAITLAATTILSVGFTAAHANAAYFYSSTDILFRSSIMLQGEIKPGDADQLQSILNDRTSHGKATMVLWLDSPGGNVVEGAKLADIVHDNGIKTIVSANRHCVSACFMVFAAGSMRMYSPQGYLGVHSASNTEGAEDGNTMVITETTARIYGSLNVPAAIIGKMVETPPEQVSWVTADDMGGWANQYPRKAMHTRAGAGKPRQPERTLK